MLVWLKAQLLNDLAVDRLTADKRQSSSLTRRSVQLSPKTRTSLLGYGDPGSCFSFFFFFLSSCLVLLFGGPLFLLSVNLLFPSLILTLVVFFSFFEFSSLDFFFFICGRDSWYI